MNSTNGITIRPATKQDLQAILAIYNSAILHTTAVYDYEPHTLSMRQGWFMAKQADGLPVLVADLNAKVVGFASLGHFRAWAAYRYTVENSIYVAPQYRGQGLGKRLLASLIEAAQAIDCHVIVAGIDADNVASCRLHEQFGFREVAHFHQVGYKFDRWLDLKFWELILPTPQHLVNQAGSR